MKQRLWLITQRANLSYRLVNGEGGGDVADASYVDAGAALAGAVRAASEAGCFIRQVVPLDPGEDRGIVSADDVLIAVLLDEA